MSTAGAELTLHDAMAGLQHAVSSSGQGHWDLQGASISPAFLAALVSQLPNTPPVGAWQGTITLDLTGNQLGAVDDWQLLVAALRSRPWLRVRLGTEVVPAKVKAALQAAGAPDLWDSQLSVDRPWENPTNKQLAKAITTLSDILRRMDAAPEDAVNSASAAAAACERAAKESDDDTRGVPVAREQQAASCMAAALQDAEVVAVGYSWRRILQGKTGDLDFLVAGTLDGVGPAIVLGEAKLDMPSKVFAALVQLEHSLGRWAGLAQLAVMRSQEKDSQLQEMDELDLMDVERLRVAELGTRQVCLAVCGASFPPKTMEHITKHMREFHKGVPWFIVHMPGGVAQLQPLD